MSGKTLVINGSPHKNGYSMTLANALFGDEHKTIHAYDTSIHSCDDCKVCAHKPMCKFKDDSMQTVIDALYETDTLVLVSPIYFGALSDQLLKILNRFQRLFGAKFSLHTTYPKIKNIYIVTTCGADNDLMFDGAKLTLSILKSLFDATHTELFGLKSTDGVNHLLLSNKERIDSFKVILKKMQSE